MSPSPQPPLLTMEEAQTIANAARPAHFSGSSGATSAGDDVGGQKVQLPNPLSNGATPRPAAPSATVATNHRLRLATASLRNLKLLFADKSNKHEFSGADFVLWIASQADIIAPMVLRRDPALNITDEALATLIGQTLLDYRLAHHVTDDYEFENSPTRFYSFVADESPEEQQSYTALSAKIIDKRDVYHQSNLQLRMHSFLGGESWRHCYAVLDDKETKPRMLHLYKRQSAAGPPFASYAVENCMCSLVECMDCKQDWYCFTLKAKKQGAAHEEKMTLCANHSTIQEGWLNALMEAGVTFLKDDYWTDLGQVQSIFELSARKLKSHETINLDAFKGKVCVVVNISSKCGLTPRENPVLVKLYTEFKDKGLEILAFPCNQFGNQEPGSEENIEQFVQGYNMTFPIFEKVNVNGSDAHPLWRFLKSKLTGVMGSSIKWNYTKFLCDKRGVPLKRYGPATSSMAMRDDIMRLLEESA